MSKLYRVALYDTEDGGHLLQEGLFTNAKLAKENFNAIKKSLPDKELPLNKENLVRKTYNKRHFTEYHTPDYDLCLHVVHTDESMVDPGLFPNNRETRYRRKNDLISLLNATAKWVSSWNDPAFKYFYDQVTDHVSKNEIISVEYANKAMTYKFRCKQNDILIAKVTEPHRYCGLNIEFS